MSSSLDVLIVGAGPVGLVMACELARRGHNLRIIEQKAQRDPWSKAAAIQPRTLEIFEDMGIIERFLDSGQKMTGVNLYKGSERLAHLDLHIQQTRYPFLLGKSQRSTEELLEARLAELGVAIERSITLLHFDQDDQQVRAILQGPDGQQDTVCAHYLIGCDGSRSRTREELGLDFEGSTFEAGLIQADVRVDFPFPTQPGEAYSFFSDQGPMGCLPLLEDHYRVIALQSEGQDGEVDFEHFQQVCAQRAPEGFAVHDPDWVVGFRFHGRLASRYRVGRVFLAGDAAHIHSPVGGQGMNLGIQDAYNLAWKLHMVLQAQAPQSLLDTYEAERRRIADTVVRSTDRASKSALRMLGNRNPLITGFRDQIVKLLFRTGFVDDLIFSAISGVDIAYPDSPLSAEHHISPLSAQIPRSGSDERPDTGDWLLFRRTLEAGARVPDCDLPTDTPLFTLRRGREHLLLAFDGRATTQSGYQTLRQLHQIAAQYPWITTRLVVLADQLPEPLHDLQDLTLLDPQGELHQHFGAMSEALYLLRPDGYVAFRSQPAEPSMLQDYLQEHYLT